MAKKQSKTVIMSIESTAVNSDTGEVLSELRYTKRKVSKEPNFIKLYLDDVMLLSDIPRSKSDVLYLLLRKMNYDNEITVVASHKRDIAKELKCSIINIDKTLALLVDKGILVRKERGVFIANPRLFGRGNWEDIEELRLRVDYSKKAGKKLIANITTKQDEMNLALFDNNSKKNEEVQSNSKSIEQ